MLQKLNFSQVENLVEKLKKCMLKWTNIRQ